MKNFTKRVNEDLQVSNKTVAFLPCPSDNCLVLLDDGVRRGHEKKLFKRRFSLDTRKFVFSNRVVDSWNSLSAQCVNSCSINTFKKYVSV